MFFFFNDTATTEIYTLSLHDALPISRPPRPPLPVRPSGGGGPCCRCWCSCRSEWHWRWSTGAPGCSRSEEHTSELHSRQYLVCRSLFEKKKKNHPLYQNTTTAYQCSD